MAGEINLTVHPIANDVLSSFLCVRRDTVIDVFVKIMPGIGASGDDFQIFFASVSYYFSHEFVGDSLPSQAG